MHLFICSLRASHLHLAVPPTPLQEKYVSAEGIVAWAQREARSLSGSADHTESALLQAINAAEVG